MEQIRNIDLDTLSEDEMWLLTILVEHMDNLTDRMRHGPAYLSNIHNTW